MEGPRIKSRVDVVQDRTLGSLSKKLLSRAQPLRRSQVQLLGLRSQEKSQASRWVHPLTRASSQDRTAQSAAAAFLPHLCRRGQISPRCLTLWYFFHRKASIVMWLNLCIFFLSPGHLFGKIPVFPCGPQSLVSREHCPASAWFFRPCFWGERDLGLTSHGGGSLARSWSRCRQETFRQIPRGKARVWVSLLPHRAGRCHGAGELCSGDQVGAL